MNPKVDFYFHKETKWQSAISRLRTILLGCGLMEDLKWGCPCYTFNANNIVLIHVFKEYCAILFFKGALLNDTNGILIQQTKNVQVARQVRFTSLQEVVKRERVLKSYIYEAIEAEKVGLKFKLKKTTEYSVPAEVQTQLDKNAALKKAFASLTPGRQRGYLLYFAAPKLAKTRESRFAKSMKRILDGKGLND